MVVADLDVDGTPVTLVSVHTQAPIHPRDIVPWQSGFADLGGLAATAAAAGRPIVLAGDWNATTGNRPFRRLLRDHHLVDAHLAVGRGRARTWPAHRSPLPPLLLLDHVVVGGGIMVRSVHERPAPGSDHLAVVADLGIPPPNSSQ
jgi:endonuclease/exonuclease/phosphatase family metal-dependent hydrolase